MQLKNKIGFIFTSLKKLFQMVLHSVSQTCLVIRIVWGARIGEEGSSQSHQLGYHQNADEVSRPPLRGAPPRGLRVDFYRILNSAFPGRALVFSAPPPALSLRPSLAD